ncbi:MAG TPA: Smr/MutS family protein [Myxococcota bacterium]|nr:Smr/MutS family protein [Myxococcota bacterium]
MSEDAALFSVEISGEHVRALAPGVDRAHLVRLVRGEVAIDVEIDLHGCDEREARALVADTLAEMHLAGERCARIVHGRGRHSVAGPVLKAALLEWLTTPPLAQSVLAFATAGPRAGGAGATLVLLRGARASGA